MNRCEDFPCCGHGPAPYGDGGGCPDSEGRFNCVECGVKLARGARSAMCDGCRYRGSCLRCGQGYLDCWCSEDY